MELERSDSHTSASGFSGEESRSDSAQESGIQTSSSSDTTDAAGVLGRLCCPKASDLARKRKVDSNPPKGKKCSQGLGVSDLKSVTPRQRVGEYPGQHFSVSNAKLFCQACREELSVKSSVLQSYIRSAKQKERRCLKINEFIVLR